MRKTMSVVLGVVAFMWTAGAARAQEGFGGLTDAVKKDVGEAAKKKADEALGVPGAAEKAAEPGAAAKEGADAATGDVKGRAAGAGEKAQGAAGDTMGGMKKAGEPAEAAPEDGE